ncbi:MAG: hypothetical protein K9N51_09440 [Candidatus Pacebacteria bacterium]|nr:hypothetical protein [Candidatus Paceibacterota bacterium]
MKRLLAIAAVAAAVCFAVIAVTNVIVNKGKDTIVLESGYRGRFEVIGYADGYIQIKTQHGLSTQTLPLHEIRRIRFASHFDEGKAPDTVTFKSGKRVPCKVVKYAGGKLTIRLPSGRRKRGGIGALKGIQFFRP